MSVTGYDTGLQCIEDVLFDLLVTGRLTDLLHQFGYPDQHFLETRGHRSVDIPLGVRRT